MDITHRKYTLYHVTISWPFYDQWIHPAMPQPLYEGGHLLRAHTLARASASRMDENDGLASRNGAAFKIRSRQFNYLILNLKSLADFERCRRFTNGFQKAITLMGLHQCR